MNNLIRSYSSRHYSHWTKRKERSGNESAAHNISRELIKFKSWMYLNVSFLKSHNRRQWNKEAFVNGSPFLYHYYIVCHCAHSFFHFHQKNFAKCFSFCVKIHFLYPCIFVSFIIDSYPKIHQKSFSAISLSDNRFYTKRIKFNLNKPQIYGLASIKLYELIPLLAFASSNHTL